MEVDYYSQSLRLHEKHRGKIEVKSKVELKSKLDLSLAYTPGVAEPCRQIAANPEEVYKYTLKQNSVAVVSDGSAVLGLGNIGANAAIPVMEGKALLFKELGGIDAFPICLQTQDAKEIVSIVKNIAPVFGGINLEDIAAPKCFEIERELKGIGIPVMHDDQHGTAIVVLAALENASKVVGKPMEKLRVVISGSGAAGVAIAKILGGRSGEIIMVDRQGIIYSGRQSLGGVKDELAKSTNKRGLKGTLADALKGADVFIGVSAPGLVTREMVSSMASDAIVFAMANPTPEISPQEAKEGGARVVATGRSDFPNQVNNSLAFPGVFRGALDCRASVINEEMKLAAAKAIARCVESPSEGKIVPDALDRKVVKEVAAAVAQAARKSGVAKKT